MNQDSMTLNKKILIFAYSCLILFRSFDSLPEFSQEKRKVIVELTYIVILLYCQLKLTC